MKILYPIITLLITILVGIHITYSYPEAANYPSLTAAAFADPTNQGMTFQFNGIVTIVRETRQGLLIITAENSESMLTIDIPVFPSIGKLDRKPIPGDSLHVIGNLGTYKGKPQLRLLAAELMQIYPYEGGKLSVAHNIKGALLAEKGASILIGPVTAINVREPDSKKQNLKFVLRDNTGLIEGVAFQKYWSPEIKEKLTNGLTFYVSARVELFKGTPSLVINSFNFDGLSVDK